MTILYMFSSRDRNYSLRPKDDIQTTTANMSHSFLHIDTLHCNGTEEDILFCMSSEWFVDHTCDIYVPWIQNCRK